MKRLILMLLLVGINYTVFAQEFCQYCFVYRSDFFGKTTSITNVYTLKKGSYMRTIGLEVCADTRETAELKRKQEIENAQRMGHRIDHQTQVGQDCDEAYERAKVQRAKEEADARAREQERQRLQAERARLKKEAETRRQEEDARRKREQEQAAKEQQEREAQAQFKASRKLAIQKTRQLYESKGPKPDSVANGWHRVTAVENEGRMYECLVLVEENRVIQVADSLSPIRYRQTRVFSGPITAGKTLLQIEDRYVDLYFMRYLDWPDDRAAPPSTGNLIFWVDSELAGEVSILLEGQTQGSITQVGLSVPLNCGDPAGLTLTEIRTGTYTFMAKSKSNTLQWQGEVSVYPNECTIERLEVGLGKAVIGVQSAEYIPLRLTIRDESGKALATHTLREVAKASRGDDCQIADGIEFIADAGRYSYVLESQNPQKWWMKSQGTIELKPRMCRQQWLPLPIAKFHLQLGDYPYKNPLELYVEGKKMGAFHQTGDLHEVKGLFRVGEASYRVYDPKIGQVLWEGELELSEGANEPIRLSSYVPTGKVIFYTTHGKVRREPITIIIDDAEVGKLITHYPYPKMPQVFGEPQALSLELPVGRHTIRTTSPGKWGWEEEIEVKLAKTQKFQLRRSGSTCYLQKWD
ncbi:MAG: cell envelope integrity protein TolA [Bacteroidota bacterium]